MMPRSERSERMRSWSAARWDFVYAWPSSREEMRKRKDSTATFVISKSSAWST